jgi:hypothetical protein
VSEPKKSLQPTEKNTSKIAAKREPTEGSALRSLSPVAVGLSFRLKSNAKNFTQIARNKGRLIPAYFF